jgi:Carboxypeptidase regulatory-like domain
LRLLAGIANEALEFSGERMLKQLKKLKKVIGTMLWVPMACLFAVGAGAQQTLSSINGAVTDPSGAAIVGAEVTVTDEQTSFTRTAKSAKDGYFQMLNLPLGTYTVKVAHDGFETELLPHIAVVQERASTVRAAMKVGQASTSVTVTENPLLNATDTTNGYTLSHDELQNIPLATGSFTQAAILSPGVSAELLSGVGTNEGLGNQAIWANGQRDTSNSFQVNGVDVTNIFNGKSASQDASQRYAFNIGQGASLGGQSQTNTSVYGSNGNGLATPPPEMISEISVKTSMYDAEGGTNSGAHIQVSTSTGGNLFHGQLYGTHATNALNAAPFFFKQDADFLPNGAANPTGSVPNSLVNSQLHKELIGASASGPIVKDKLFLYLGYQFMHDSDQFKGFSTPTVPIGLTNDRSAAGIIAAANSNLAAGACNGNFGVGKTYVDAPTCYSAQTGLAANTYTGTIDPVAMALFNAKLPNGQYLLPSVQNTNPAAIFSGAGNVFLPGEALFGTNLMVADLDYDLTKRDRLSAKYFYQHAPNASPYTIANTGGFPELVDNGAQVASLGNTITLGSRISWNQLFGFSRQKVYSNFAAQVTNGGIGIGFPSGIFPGLSLGDFAQSHGGTITTGPESTSVDDGYFQSRWNPSTNFFYTWGKHNISAGSTYSYTQLNIRNDRGGFGEASTSSLASGTSNLLTGVLSKSTYLAGNANRYYRSNESGSFLQDKWQLLSNLSITAGLRFDYNGPLWEANGDMFNFNPALYSATANAVTNSGFVVASNNKFFPTAGASKSTLTGRQWGLGPRVGFAFSPNRDHGKVVISGGTGFYYDRGENFTYLSQPAGSGIGGPFGVTTAPPLTNLVTGSGTRTLENPLGTAVVPIPSANPAFFTSQLPTANNIRTSCTAIANQQNDGCLVPFSFGSYAAANKLPYSINYSFTIQMQPTNTLAFTLGYVGNVGRHGVIPVPFNEPGIATPTNPINGETSSYGYQVLNQNSPLVIAGGTPAKPTTTTYFNSISTEPYNTDDGGNIDLRVPYVGYSPNATLYTAAGVSSYNALQTQMQKRMSRHVQATVAYTWSHTLDEQSDIGLFFTGDNPDHLRDSYASADFDRTNTLTSAFVFTSPDVIHEKNFASKFLNDWQLSGIVVAESGQPYSLYEFDGAVGSLYFGNFPTLANPVLGIKDGAHPKSALTGHVGAFQNSTDTGYFGAINVNQLNVNLIQPGQKGVPACTTANEACDYYETDFTPGQRNIFRQAFQKRADLSMSKTVKVGDRYSAVVSFNAFNVTNTPSFDVPNNSASIAQGHVGTTLPAVTGNTYATTAFGQVVSTPGGQGNLGATAATSTGTLAALYKLPTTNGDGSTTSTFGAVRNTIGSSRVIEMSLHFNY